MHTPHLYISALNLNNTLGDRNFENAVNNAPEEVRTLFSSLVWSNESACDFGGSMYGKCETGWDWNAGWWLIRVEQGLISANAVPEEYQSILDDYYAAQAAELAEALANVAVAVPVNTTAGCVSIGSGNYVNFAGGNFATGMLYFDTTCSSGGPFSASYAFSTVSAANALGFCNANGTFTSVTAMGNNAYTCNP